MRFDISVVKIFETIVHKIVTQPLIPVANSWIDATPFLLMFLFLSFSAFFLWRFGRNELARWGSRLLATFVFVFLLHRCLCVLRGLIFGIQEIGRDELRAFGELCMFVPVIGFSLTMGRVFCGWVCPLGFLQEIFGRFSLFWDKKFKNKNMRKVVNLVLFGVIFCATFWFLYLFKPSTDFFTENVAACFSIGLLFILPFVLTNQSLAFSLRKIRYVSLSLWLVLGFFGIYGTNPWCVLYGGELDYSSLLALFVVLSTSLVVPLAWCRYICPLGALLSILTRVFLIKVRSSGKCKNCGRCEDVCIIGAMKKGKLHLSSCIQCGRCLKECVRELEIKW